MQKDDYTLIEKYLQGELNEEEANAFRLRLQEDTALAEEYTLRKSMAIFLEKDRNQASLQPQLEALGKTYFVEEKKAKVIPFYRNRLFIGLASAAAIALLLIFWNPFQSRSLYDQYAFHQPISLTEKSTGTDLAAKAENSFNQKNYAQAYQDLTNYLQQAPEDQKARLALGVSALETGKTQEAIDIFTTIHNGSSALKYYGTWNLALAYVKAKDSEKAKTFLKQIPESEKMLFAKANEFLKKL